MITEQTINGSLMLKQLPETCVHILFIQPMLIKKKCFANEVLFP